MDAAPLAFAIVAFIALGSLLGFASGLVPGVHPNTLAALILLGKAVLLGLIADVVGDAFGELTALSAFLVAAVVAHGTASFLPSVFLGAPGEGNALSVLPGHRLLREGRGPEAVCVAAKGGVLGAAATAALLLPVRWAMAPPIDGYERVRTAIPWVLVVLVALLLLSEGPRRVRDGTRSAWAQRGRAAVVFLASGLLGWAVLGTGLADGWNWFPVPGWAGDGSARSLLPMFTGLFGLSTLVLSLRGRARVAPQSPSTRSACAMRRAVVCGALAGAAVSWLPGLSSGAATSLAQFLARRRSGDEDPMEFMASLGSVGTATAVFTVAALFIIGRARSGVAVAVRELQGATPWGDPLAVPVSVLVVLAAALASSAIAYPLAVRATRPYARLLARLPYRGLAAAVAGGLIALVAISAGAIGLLVAASGLALGMVPPRWGVKRVHLMGALIVPVLLLIR